MQTIGIALVAGFIATIALSVMMLLKAAMGLMPQLDPVSMLTGMARGFMGAPATPAMGWILHFLIGTVAWGILFSWLAPWLPGGYWVKGIIFGAGAWLVMMIIVLPMAGAGLFGLNLGMGAPAMTLALHLVYGTVLGVAYGKLLEI
jgi:hypothetical protein